MKVNLTVLKRAGEPILTTRELSAAYGVSEVLLRKNYQRNIERYVEGKHYFLLAGEELKDFLACTSYGGKGSKIIRKMYLWTERGAFLHAKSLNTEKAWEVYEVLVESYFRVREGKDNLSVVSLNLAKLRETASSISCRVQNLENNMTIDYGQQLTLQEAVKISAVIILGGARSKAYKDSGLRSRVFSQAWRDFKEYFQVNSYRNTRTGEFEKAREYLMNWKPRGKLLREIEDINKGVMGVRN
ncbi:MAG: ORF6C domain-containing protein [Clostridiaceae bacterium]